MKFFFVKTHLPGLSGLRLIFFKTENLVGEEGLAEVYSCSPGLTHNSSESLTREILLFPVTAAAKNQDDNERSYLKSRSYIRWELKNLSSSHPSTSLIVGSWLLPSLCSSTVKNVNTSKFQLECNVDFNSWEVKSS